MANKLAAPLAILMLLALFLAPFLSFGVTPAPPDAPTVSLAALGDVTFGRYVGAEAQKEGNFDFPFTQIAPQLHAVDLALANLEGPLVADPPTYIPANQQEADQLKLIGDIKAAPALARAGFKVMDLANNHILDAGPAGINSSISALRAAGITPVGAGETEDQARQPVVLSFRGLRVALLARTAIESNYILLNGGPHYPGPAFIDANDIKALDQLSADIGAARKQADVVILLMHWGQEYTTTINEAQKTIATWAANSGVAMIIGAHPHVAQPPALVPGAANQERGAFVAYSLGNAVFDQFFSPDVKQGLLLSATLSKQGVDQALLKSLPRDNYTPHLADAADPDPKGPISRIYAAASPELRQLALSKPQTTGSDESYQLLPALGFYQPGAASATAETDLTGDGATESLTLQDGRLTVRQQEPGARQTRQLWVSPVDWRIDRFRVAEADQLKGDGQEIAFTVWKPPRQGEFIPPALQGINGQHFFLFGERNNEIVPVWNSSILPDPMIDFNFAPGPPVRLVTIEGSYGKLLNAQAVAVWGWTGFGYSLEWRSPPLSDPNLGHLEWRDAMYIFRR